MARSFDDVDKMPSAVTIGVFDGVHRGHRVLLDAAKARAAEQGLRSVVVTFDRHPMEVVKPGSQPKYLQNLDRKITSLLAEGLDLVYVVPFTYEFSQQSALQFVEQTLCGSIDARHVTVGANFRFGHGAEGDVAMLEQVGTQFDFTVKAVDLLEVDGVPISSSEVRDRIARGEVEWAAQALGRPHVLEGAVVRGDERGRTIGFPTANVEVDDRMQMPANGVYAGHAVVLGRDGHVYPMVVNVGVRPTFGGGAVTVEAFLIDAELDLYGEHLAVSFEHRLRDEMKFGSIDDLVAAIDADVEQARRLLTP